MNKAIEVLGCVLEGVRVACTPSSPVEGTTMLAATGGELMPALIVGGVVAVAAGLGMLMRRIA